jgi:hypothetical protein
MTGKSEWDGYVGTDQRPRGRAGQQRSGHQRDL